MHLNILQRINMTYSTYRIATLFEETEATYRMQLQPLESDTIFAFKPGQYCYLKNPEFTQPNEPHPFSIASSPLEKDSLEFCIKGYGDWTQEMLKKKVGSELFVSQPQGSFTWDDHTSFAVFLLGGIGISPIMSMLQTIAIKKQTPELTLIYGNRTPETIAYEKELNALIELIPQLKLVHVFSDIPEDHPWNGYRGFVTRDILEKEVDFSKKPLFYYVGPPIFMDKMRDLLKSLDIPEKQRKEEVLAKK